MAATAKTEQVRGAAARRWVIGAAVAMGLAMALAAVLPAPEEPVRLHNEVMTVHSGFSVFTRV